MRGVNVIDEKEMEEFREWRRSKSKTEFDRIFSELDDLTNNPNGKNYNATMPVRAFKVMATAILLLKEKVVKWTEEHG